MSLPFFICTRKTPHIYRPQKLRLIERGIGACHAIFVTCDDDDSFQINKNTYNDHKVSDPCFHDDSIYKRSSIIRVTCEIYCKHNS